MSGATQGPGTKRAVPPPASKSMAKAPPRPMPQPQPKGPKVLRIGVVQGGRIIEERIIRKRESVSVGPSERNTFVIPSPNLPNRFEIFELRNNAYTLVFADDMDGRVSVPGGLADFATLKSSGRAKRKGPFWQVDLSEESRGKVVIGESTILFQFVTPPPIQPRPQLPAAARGGWIKGVDWTFLAVTMLAFVMEFGFVVYVVVKDWPLEHAYDARPDRFARLLDDQPTEEELEQLREQLNGDQETTDTAEEQAGDTEEQTETKTQQKGSGLSAEERAAIAEQRAREAAERRARLTDAMSRVAMAKIIGFGGEGDGAVADVLRGGDLGGDMDDLMSQVKGVGVARSGEGGGVLRNVAAGSGDGAGGVADISQLRAKGGNQNVDSGGVGGERQVRGKMKRGNLTETGGTGRLSGDEVRRVVGENIGGIKGCYERALRRNPTLEGRIVINFSVGGGGRVLSASTGENSMGAPEVADCIVGRFRSMRFPPPEGGNVTFQYPFIFQPEQ